MYIAHNLQVWRLEYDVSFSGRLVEHVGLIAGIGSATVSRVFAEDKNGEGFQSKRRDQSSRVVFNSESRLTTLRELVDDALKRAVATSTIKIAKLLKENHGISCSLQTIRRALHAMGYRWGVGKKRHLLAMSLPVIAYRAEYVRRKINNRMLDEHGGPITAEVFLDETFCHLYHTKNQTWVLKGANRPARSKGPKYIIVGAFVVFRNGDSIAHAEWVEDSIKMWNPQAKKNTDDAFLRIIMAT